MKSFRAFFFMLSSKKAYRHNRWVGNLFRAETYTQKTRKKRPETVTESETIK